MINEKNLRYLTAGCFIIAGLLNLYFSITLDYEYYGYYSPSISDFVYPLGCFLIAISAFISVPILATTGCCINAIMQIDSCLRYLTIPKFFFLLFWILLTATSLNKKTAKQLGLAASVVGTLHVITYIANLIFYNWGIHYVLSNIPDFLSTIFYFAFRNIPLIAGGFLLGLAITTMPQDKFITNKTNTASTTTTPKNIETQTERLAKLKTLLDAGHITPEEFEAKKKEILSL